VNVLRIRNVPNDNAGVRIGNDGMIIGLLRIKNEARWIARVVRSIQPVCGRILIFDDHSTDGTPEICESLGCRVFRRSLSSQIPIMR
jgi:hypothetical protein